MVSASVNFLDGTKIEQQRILLAVYPLLYVPFYAKYKRVHSLPFVQAFLFHSCLDDYCSVIRSLLVTYLFPFPSMVPLYHLILVSPLSPE